MPSHSVEGPDDPWRLLACTYHLVDVIREYSHVFQRGPTRLMATLVFDPAGRELFERWHYEISRLEDQAGLPTAVPDTHDTDGAGTVLHSMTYREQKPFAWLRSTLQC